MTITNIQVTGGFAAKLPAIEGKTFLPSTGLNVFFGPNGCGKTTLLKISAAYSGCVKGWSNPIEPLYIPRSMNKAPIYPDIFREISPGNSTAVVEWDGVASLWYEPVVSVGSRFSEDGEELMLQLKSVMSNASSGERVVELLHRLRDVLKESPDLCDINREWNFGGERVTMGRCNSVWEDAIKSFVEYVKTLPRTEESRVSVFLDEPDRSLSLKNQQILWSKILPMLANKRQVFVSTHSPFATLSPGAIIHDMIPGYAQECMETMRVFAVK